VDNQVTYSAGYFTYNTNLTIADSGQWQIQVKASDSDNNIDVETIIWNIPWGNLDCSLISPTSDITVPKSSSFTVQASVQCLDAECPDVNIGLNLNKPKELIYDDYSAEDYGDAGTTEGYLAVRLTPTSYPAQLKTARFYIWDKTTYPFELNVWDDNGKDEFGIENGSPGNMLITPMIVDPVVASSADPNVAWFDVDLSTHNITIISGDFFIGVRQIEEGKLNQLGFDMSGNSHQTYPNSWASGLGVDWFKLDDYCRFCELNPEICEDEWFCMLFPEICDGSLYSQYCGNLMIRGMVSEPGTYSGELPISVGSTILYTTDDHPKSCPNPDMDPGQNCQVSLNVHAVGPVGEYTKFHAFSANNYSSDSAGPIKVTISAPLTPCDAANLDAVYPVDYLDLAILADQWLQTTPPLFADIDNDLSVNFRDLAFMARFWLQPCD
jgi:hypothetical protein